MKNVFKYMEKYELFNIYVLIYKWKQHIFFLKNDFFIN